MTAATRPELLGELDTLTVLSLAAILHDKKGFTKVAVKLLKRVHPRVAQQIVKQVLEAPRYKTAIHAHLWYYLNFTRCAKEIGQDLKHHGMVIYGEDVYPVRFEIASEEDLPWMFANQNQLRVTAAEAVMRLLDRVQLYCHVLLFANRGFDGMALEVEIEHNPLS